MQPIGNGEGVFRPYNFALVSYLPEPFATVLAELRGMLEHDAPPHSAHLTILPPRPVLQPSGRVWDQLRPHLEELEPLELELGDVEMFVDTHVIYVSIRSGYQRAVGTHDRLKPVVDGIAGFHQAAFAYHPHVTLAKGLDPAEAYAALDYARRRWRDFEERRVILDALHLVESNGSAEWINRGVLHLRKLALS
jgi:2'-5' RNA ligase